MAAWTPEFETELTQLLKDWLKQQGKTQADLRRSIRAISTRMPSLLEVLEREHKQGGLAGLAARLCRVEAEWSNSPAGGGEASAKQPTLLDNWICFSRKSARTHPTKAHQSQSGIT